MAVKFGAPSPSTVKSGITTLVGDGQLRVFSIPHTLGKVPSSIIVTPGDVVADAAAPIMAAMRSETLAGGGGSTAPTVAYYRGVNITTFGAEHNLPTATYQGGDTQASLNYLKSRGVDIVRIPFPWGKIQPTLGGALAFTDGAGGTGWYQRLKDLVNRCRTAGIQVVLDNHDNGTWGSNMSGYRYPGGGGYTHAWGPAPGNGIQPITQQQAADLWLRLWADLGTSVFGGDLINEPFDLPGALGDTQPRAMVQSYQQYIVTALRNAGCTWEIWIEGMNSSQPVNWTTVNGPSPWITDPLGNVVYSYHTYPLSSFSGAQEFNPGDDNTANFLSRIQAMNNWAAANNVRLGVGETGHGSLQNGAPATHAQYENLMRQAFALWNASNTTVTYWAASAVGEEGYLVYVSSQGNTVQPIPYTLNTARSSAAPLEENPSKSGPGGGGGGTTVTISAPSATAFQVVFATAPPIGSLAVNWMVA